MQKQKLRENNTSLFIVQVLFGVMFGIMLFPSMIKSLLIIIFSLGILILSYNKGFKLNKSLFFVNAAVYLGFLLTLVYTSNFSYASLKLQTGFSLLLFPFLFSLLKMSDVRHILKNTKIYLFVFIVSTFLYNVIPFLWYYATHYSLPDIIKHYPLIIIEDIGKYSIHPIYMSMHCVLSIFFSIHLFKHIKYRVIKILLLLMNVTLVCFLMIYARKGPILAFIIILFLWSFFKERKIRKYYLFMIFIVSILVLSVPNTRTRFLELTKIEDAKSSSSSSTNIRFSIYKVSLFLIKEAPFLGYGIGDFNDMLVAQYNKTAKFLVSQKYNSHNQYLSVLLIGGVPLLLLFLYCLYYNISLSIIHKNHLLIIILGFYSVVMLSENILERENGVIFFSFLLNFFALNNYTQKNEG